MMQSWHLRESLQNALHGLSQYVTAIPANESDRHFFIVTLVQRNRQTNIEFDIQQLEGGVRATGLLCLLGVGIGLGSVVVYRLYTTLCGGNVGATPRAKRPSSADIRAADGTKCDDLLAETPDSGIAADELTALLKSRQFRKLRRSCSDCGIAARRATGWNQISELFDDEDEFTVISLPVLRGSKRSAAVEDWLARTDVARSEGCLTPWNNDPVCNQYDSIKYRSDRANVDPSCRSSGFMSADLPGFTSADFTSSEQGDQLSGIFSSGGVMHRVGRTGYFTRSDGVSGGSIDLSGSLIDAELRRRGIGGSERIKMRRLSFSSETSRGMASDYTYHESLVSKGFSIDLGEDLAGMITPPEYHDDIKLCGLERWTESSMEKLHEELRMIQKDIDDMNERVGGLQSRDNIFYAIVPAGDFSPSGSSPSEHPTDLMRFSPFDFSMQMVSAGLDESTLLRQGRNASRDDSEVLRRSSSPLSCCDSDVFTADGACGLGGDFMWDYQSDLALELSDNPSFVASRPVIEEKFRQSEERSSCGDVEEFHVLNADQCVGGGTSADLYIDDDLITLKVHCSPSDQVNMKNFDDALVPSGDLMDWFDGEENWGPSASRPNAHPTSERQSKRDNRNNERSRRKNSLSSLHDILLVRRGSKSRGSSGTSSGSRHREIKPAAVKRLHEGDVLRQAVNASTSRPCSGRSLLDSSQYTPPLGSRPPTGVSTPVATVKPITESIITVAPAVTCCHGNVPAYDVVSEGVARSSVGWVVENIGARVNAQERVERNEMTHTAKQGYRQILRLWNKNSVRPVRADMYCSLRAVLYQAMLKQLPILSGAKTLDYCYQQLSKCIASTHSYMSNWNFANRLPFARESVQMKLAECLHALFEQVSAVSLMPSEACREEYLVALFNRNPDTDLRLLEAVKVLMMLKAVSLYEDFTSGRAVASYVWQLFTRDTSRSIEELFTHHINTIGDTTRLSRAEMCLLGSTLGLRIQVARPYCTEAEELIAIYPDEGADRYEPVQIIEEADSGSHCVFTS